MKRAPIAIGMAAALGGGALLVAERDGGAPTVERTTFSVPAVERSTLVGTPGVPTFQLPTLGAESGKATFGGSADVRQHISQMFQRALPSTPAPANQSTAVGVGQQVANNGVAQAVVVAQAAPPFAQFADRVCPILLAARAQVVTQLDSLIARFPNLAGQLGAVRNNALQAIDAQAERFGCVVSPG